MKRSFGVPDDDLAFTLAQRYKDSGDDAGHLARYVLRGSATALQADARDAARYRRARKDNWILDDYDESAIDAALNAREQP